MNSNIVLMIMLCLKGVALQLDKAQGAMPDSSEGATGNCRQDTVQGNMPKSSRGCGNLQRKIEI